MNLKLKYENYLNKKSEFEKEKYLYDSKKTELLDKVIKSLTEVDQEAINELGYEFELDKDKLSDTEYLITKVQELKVLREKLESRGQELLKDF